jgi:hypothetical protein
MNTKIETAADHEMKLLNLWSQLGGAMMQRGLDHARIDDPHLFARAAKWLAESNGRFQLRVDFDAAAGTTTTRGLIADTEGEAVLEVFTIRAAAGGTSH